MPDTYRSQFSGEEIDAALRAAQIISGADTPAELRKKLEIRGDTIPVSAEDSTLISGALKYRCNPNLLDNWFFGRPVNQRGQTEYTAGGVYTLDRWMSSTTTKTIKILDDHLSIVDTADYGAFLQRFEYKGLLGRTVTLSVLAKRTAQGAQNPYITVMIGNNKFEGWGEIVQSDDYQLSYCTVTLSATAPSEGYFFVDIVGMAGSSVDIKAAKLELGGTQTLAHKEGDKWVLNEIPDYGEQLRRCQRYARAYKTLLGQTFLPLGAYRSDRKAVSFVLPTSSFRAVPTVSVLNDIFQLFDGTNVYGITSLAVIDYSDGLVSIYAYTSQSFEAGKVLWLFSNTGTLLLSADL